MENDLSLRQLHIYTAFLNGDVNEEIYMDQPEGFIEEKSKDKVCKLSKSIYGLKQAGSQWFLKIDEVIKHQSKYDQRLYYLKKRDIVLIVALCVDDIIIASNNENAADEFILKLKQHFEVKDLGNLKIVLDLKSIKRKTICQFRKEDISKI